MLCFASVFSQILDDFGHRSLRHQVVVDLHERRLSVVALAGLDAVGIDYFDLIFEVGRQRFGEHHQVRAPEHITGCARTDRDLELLSHAFRPPVYSSEPAFALLDVNIGYSGSRRDLNASAIRLISLSIAGAFESNLLGSQAYAYEMPAYALTLSVNTR